MPSLFASLSSAKSEQTNKSRLRILQTREQHLQELFDGSRKRLTELTKDQSKYQDFLQGLILQVSTDGDK